MIEADSLVTHAINALSGAFPVVDGFMVLFSGFGIPVLVGLTALQWWRGQERAHLRHTLVAAGLSFLLGLGLNQIILLFIHRLRPYDGGVSHLLIARSADWSFPSDHATASAAIASAFLLHRMPREGLFFLAAAAVMMFSRVYVGTHYVGDVLGGAATGFIAALAVAKLYREGTRADRLVTGLF